jgi:hypothetical protein
MRGKLPIKIRHYKVDLTLAPQKIKVSRWRIKTVLQNIIYCAVRLVRHAGRTELHFRKRCPWFAVIRDIAFACTSIRSSAAKRERPARAEESSRPELQKNVPKEMGFEPKVPETALDIENQAAVCFSPPHCRSLELDFGFEFQQEELSNGFR